VKKVGGQKDCDTKVGTKKIVKKKLGGKNDATQLATQLFGSRNFSNKVSYQAFVTTML
jgi:hypothetical protein